MDDEQLWYDRQGNPITEEQWSRLLHDRTYRHMAYTVVGTPREPRYAVSTLWLGLNYAMPGDPPEIFETLTFGPPGTEVECRGRWCTEAHTLAGHVAVVGELLTEIGPDAVAVDVDLTARPVDDIFGPSAEELAEAERWRLICWRLGRITVNGPRETPAEATAEDLRHVQHLIDKSSLGTPGARALQQCTDPAEVEHIRKLADGNKGEDTATE
jgi:hypothetical protein